MISVELAPKSTMKVVPHTFLNVEHFLLYQIQHKYMLSQQEAMPKWTNFNLVLNDTVLKVVALLANGKEETDTSKNIEDLEGTAQFDCTQNECDRRKGLQSFPANTLTHITR